MTDLEKVRSVLDNQQERGITSGDWDRCECEFTELDRNLHELKLKGLSISFYFNQRGRFVGIANWKE